MKIKLLPLSVLFVLAMAAGVTLGWWGVMAVVAGGIWYQNRQKHTLIEQSVQRAESGPDLTKADRPLEAHRQTAQKRQDSHFADGLITGMVLMDLAHGDDEMKKDSLEPDHLEEDWMMTDGFDDGLDDGLDDDLDDF